MTAANARHTCERCGATFAVDAPHTEIVRRDFVGVPRPSRIERLCRDCWETYVEEFLEADFTEQVAKYDLE